MKLETVVAVRPDKTVYRDGENIIKVFSPDKRKSDVLNEALNQARVEETGINIPKIKDVTCLEDGRWAIVMDYIPGKTLAAMMEEHPENLDEYLEKFVDIQLKMHAQKVPLLNKLKDKMSRKISETGAQRDHSLRAQRAPREHAQAYQAVPRRLQPQQRHHPRRRRGVRHRLAHATRATRRPTPPGRISCST